MYEPRTGRFTQIDPILANRPTEHYIYAGNKPVVMVDPMGLAPGDWWDPRTYTKRWVNPIEVAAQVVGWGNRKSTLSETIESGESLASGVAASYKIASHLTLGAVQELNPRDYDDPIIRRGIEQGNMAGAATNVALDLAMICGGAASLAQNAPGVLSVTLGEGGAAAIGVSAPVLIEATGAVVVTSAGTLLLPEAAEDLATQMSHTPGRDHRTKSDPKKKESFQKKAEKEAEEARKAAEEAWKKYDSLNDEVKKLLGDKGKLKMPRPKP